MNVNPLMTVCLITCVVTYSGLTEANRYSSFKHEKKNGGISKLFSLYGKGDSLGPFKFDALKLINAEKKGKDKRTTEHTTLTTEDNCLTTTEFDRCATTSVFDRCATTTEFDRCATTTESDRHATTRESDRRATTTEFDRCATTTEFDRCATTTEFDRCATTIEFDRCATTTEFDRCATTTEFDESASSSAMPATGTKKKKSTKTTTATTEDECLTEHSSSTKHKKGTKTTKEAAEAEFLTGQSSSTKNKKGTKTTKEATEDECLTEQSSSTKHKKSSSKSSKQSTRQISTTTTATDDNSSSTTKRNKNRKEGKSTIKGKEYDNSAVNSGGSNKWKKIQTFFFGHPNRSFNKSYKVCVQTTTEAKYEEELRTVQPQQVLTEDTLDQTTSKYLNYLHSIPNDINYYYKDRLQSNEEIIKKNMSFEEHIPSNNKLISVGYLPSKHESIEVGKIQPTRFYELDKVSNEIVTLERSVSYIQPGEEQDRISSVGINDNTDERTPPMQLYQDYPRQSFSEQIDIIPKQELSVSDDMLSKEKITPTSLNLPNLYEKKQIHIQENDNAITDIYNYAKVPTNNNIEFLEKNNFYDKATTNAGFFQSFNTIRINKDVHERQLQLKREETTHNIRDEYELSMVRGNPKLSFKQEATMELEQPSNHNNNINSDFSYEQNHGMEFDKWRMESKSKRLNEVYNRLINHHVTKNHPVTFGLEKTIDKILNTNLKRININELEKNITDSSNMFLNVFSNFLKKGIPEIFAHHSAEKQYETGLPTMLAFDKVDVYNKKPKQHLFFNAETIIPTEQVYNNTWNDLANGEQYSAMKYYPTSNSEMSNSNYFQLANQNGLSKNDFQHTISSSTTVELYNIPSLQIYTEQTGYKNYMINHAITQSSNYSTLSSNFSSLYSDSTPLFPDSASLSSNSTLLYSDPTMHSFNFTPLYSDSTPLYVDSVSPFTNFTPNFYNYPNDLNLTVAGDSNLTDCDDQYCDINESTEISKEPSLEATVTFPIIITDKSTQTTTSIPIAETPNTKDMKQEPVLNSTLHPMMLHNLWEIQSNLNHSSPLSTSHSVFSDDKIAFENQHNFKSDHFQSTPLSFPSDTWSSEWTPFNIPGLEDEYEIIGSTTLKKDEDSTNKRKIEMFSVQEDKIRNSTEFPQYPFGQHTKPLSNQKNRENVLFFNHPFEKQELAEKIDKFTDNLKENEIVYQSKMKKERKRPSSKISTYKEKLSLGKEKYNFRIPGFLGGKIKTENQINFFSHPKGKLTKSEKDAKLFIEPFFRNLNKIDLMVPTIQGKIFDRTNGVKNEIDQLTRTMNNDTNSINRNLFWRNSNGASRNSVSDEFTEKNDIDQSTKTMNNDIKSKNIIPFWRNSNGASRSSESEVFIEFSEKNKIDQSTKTMNNDMNIKNRIPFWRNSNGDSRSSESEAFIEFSEKNEIDQSTKTVNNDMNIENIIPFLRNSIRPSRSSESDKFIEFSEKNEIDQSTKTMNSDIKSKNRIPFWKNSNGASRSPESDEFKELTEKRKQPNGDTFDEQPTTWPLLERERENNNKVDGNKIKDSLSIDYNKMFTDQSRNSLPNDDRQHWLSKSRYYDIHNLINEKLLASETNSHKPSISSPEHITFQSEINANPVNNNASSLKNIANQSMPEAVNNMNNNEFSAVQMSAIKVINKKPDIFGPPLLNPFLNAFYNFNNNYTGINHEMSEMFTKMQELANKFGVKKALLKRGVTDPQNYSFSNSGSWRNKFLFGSNVTHNTVKRSNHSFNSVKKYDFISNIEDNKISDKWKDKTQRLIDKYNDERNMFRDKLKSYVTNNNLKHSETGHELLEKLSDAQIHQNINSSYDSYGINDKQFFDSDKTKILKRDVVGNKKMKSRELEFILEKNLPRLPLNKRQFISYMMNGLKSIENPIIVDDERHSQLSKGNLQNLIDRNVKKDKVTDLNKEPRKKHWQNNAFP